MENSLKAERFLYREEPFGGMIIARDSGHELLLNHSAFFIARLYLGDCLTPNEIVDRIVEQYDISSTDGLEKQISGVIADVERYFLFSGKYVSSWNSVYAPVQAPEVLSAPVSVFWEITSLCNQSCCHCYNTSGQQAEGELTTEECLQLIDELHEAGTYKLIIGGGEPFCRPDFLHLVRSASERGMSMVTATNGTLLDDAACDLALECRDFKLLVSLHDFVAERHDLFCGLNGAYELTLAGLKLLKQRGVKFGIQSMLTKAICENMERFFAFVNSLGAQSLHLKSAVPIGKECMNRSCLEDNELLQYRNRVEALAKEYSSSMQVHFGIPLSDTREKQMETCEPVNMKLSCGPGFRNCGILPDGRLVACSFLRGENWTSEWSVRDKPFKELWVESSIFTPFRLLSSVDIEQCNTCSRLGSECNAGCRARAFNETGNFYARDPRCYLG